MKKVLIITGSFGNGHIQVSNSIKDEFRENYSSDVLVVESDLFLEAHPNLTPILKEMYLYSFSYFRDIYGYLYYAGKRHKNMSSYRYFSYHYLRKLIEKEYPDIIVSVFPTPALSLLESTDIPIVNVVTDYYFHKSWLTKNAYRYFVSNEDSKRAFIEAGVDSDKVKVYGIPINTKFDEEVDKKQWYDKNNLSLDKKTIMISAGAFGVTNNFENIINKIIDLEKLQVVIICGKNKQLKMELEKKLEEYKDIKIIGYSNDMREWMQTSDVLITKAGGVTISEALASRVPLILLNPVPGQEGENASYFERNGLAKIANSESEIIEHLTYFLNENNLKLVKNKMNTCYIPHSTKNVCKAILNILNKREAK
ncbi:MGDG synthase family glycosyltransferase [Gemella sanguinis]